MHGLITKCVMTVGGGVLVLHDIGVNVDPFPMTGSNLGDLGAFYLCALVLEQVRECVCDALKLARVNATKRTKPNRAKNEVDTPPLFHEARPA